MDAEAVKMAAEVAKHLSAIWRLQLAIQVALTIRSSCWPSLLRGIPKDAWRAAGNEGGFRGPQEAIERKHQGSRRDQIGSGSTRLGEARVEQLAAREAREELISVHGRLRAI